MFSIRLRKWKLQKNEEVNLKPIDKRINLWSDVRKFSHKIPYSCRLWLGRKSRISIIFASVASYCLWKPSGWWYTFVPFKREIEKWLCEKLSTLSKSWNGKNTNCTKNVVSQLGVSPRELIWTERPACTVQWGTQYFKLSAYRIYHFEQVLCTTSIDWKRRKFSPQFWITLLYLNPLIHLSTWSYVWPPFVLYRFGAKFKSCEQVFAKIRPVFWTSPGNNFKYKSGVKESIKNIRSPVVPGFKDNPGSRYFDFDSFKIFCLCVIVVISSRTQSTELYRITISPKTIYNQGFNY